MLMGLKPHDVRLLVHGRRAISLLLDVATKKVKLGGRLGLDLQAISDQLLSLREGGAVSTPASIVHVQDDQTTKVSAIIS